MATKESYERANRSPALAASELHESFEVLQGRLDQQQWDEAIAELIRLILRVPEDLNLRLRLAHLYLKVENNEKAIEEFHLCAQAFYERAQYKDALGAATSILKLEPDSQFALEMVRKSKKKLDFVREVASHPLREILLEALPAEGLKELTECLEVFVYPQGKTVIEEGETGCHLFLIRQGEAQVFVTDREGNRVRLAVFRDGDFFGEVSLLTVGPGAGTVVATQPSEFWVLEKPDFDRMITKYPRFKELIHRHSQQRVKDTIERIHTDGIDRRLFPRIPVKVEAWLVVLDKDGRPSGIDPLTGAIQNLSLSGARFRAPLSHPRQWDLLTRVGQACLNFSVARGADLSLTCKVERARQDRMDGEVYVELGLSFGKLAPEDNEQINKFITRQLLSEAFLG